MLFWADRCCTSLLLRTFQAIQGENGYFMALDMETGGVSMIPLHDRQKHQQVKASRSGTLTRECFRRQLPRVRRCLKFAAAEKQSR